MPEDARLPPGSIFLKPGEGRAYEMGALRAVFKADGDETQNRFCVSEWWLEPNTKDRARIATRRTTRSFT